MDQTSFQNGFVCGMAAKGLVRSGELYKPTIYNDSGGYSYFYIDFRRTIQAFSLGMFNESIIVYDSQQVSVSRIEQTGTTVYKVYCDITNKIHGITVLNKKTSRLRFATGEILPVFSVHMFIGGQTAFIDGAYVYNKSSLQIPQFTGISEITDNILWTSVYAGSQYESVSLAQVPFTTSENFRITFT